MTNMLKNLVKKNYKDIFSSKFMLQYGLQLGGHIHLLNVETSSIIFGIRNFNIIINVNLTALEIVKVLKIVKNLGLKRSVIYFINSSMSFRLSFKNTFSSYNRHLFFPVNQNIRHLLKKFKYFFLKKVLFRRNKRKKKIFFLTKKEYFFLKSGKALLRKMFISSKWSFGFVSNQRSFFKYTKNVFLGKVKMGKNLADVKANLKRELDFFPFFPNYGFIGDHKTNYWVVNELQKAKVPTSSVVDTFTEKSLFAMYGIPGNSCSIDSTLFFLILTISNYLLGFYNQVLRFCFNKLLKIDAPLKVFLKEKKQLFFKRFKLLKLII
jgi:ribosomal protein S2